MTEIQVFEGDGVERKINRIDIRAVVVNGTASVLSPGRRSFRIRLDGKLTLHDVHELRRQVAGCLGEMVELNIFELYSDGTEPAKSVYVGILREYDIEDGELPWIEIGIE